MTTGFTAGIGVLIFSSQMQDFFGLGAGSPPPDFLHKWAFYLKNAGTFDPRTLGIALTALAVIILVRRHVPRIPAPVAGVVAASVLAWALWPEVATIGSRFGGIPAPCPRCPCPT